MDSSWEAFDQSPMDLNKPDAWNNSAFPLLDTPDPQADTPFDSTTMFDDAFGSPAADEVPSIDHGSSAKPSTLAANETVSQGHGQVESSYTSHPAISPRSHRSSSRDSSESSRGRKRKSSSKSSPSDQFEGMNISNESRWSQSAQEMSSGSAQYGVRDSAVSLRAPFDTMSINQEEDINKSMASAFDFDSAASSPGAFGLQSSAVVDTNGRSKSDRFSAAPMTVRPAPFIFGSRDTSPIHRSSVNPYEINRPAVLGGDSSVLQSQEVLTPEQLWNPLPQNANWPTAISPKNLVDVASSPMDVGSPPYATPRSSPARGIIHLHIDPINPKSRVETQISIKLTMSALPPGVTRLHLPTCAISKPKLLAKKIEKSPDTLELHTSLVCTSAMEKDDVRERAFRRARGEEPIEERPSKRRASAGDGDEVSDPDDPDKPINGGEVRICQNCINRERKRAARKKPKNEDDEERWNSYESQRVIVFNTSEYKDWQPLSAGNESAAETMNPQSYAGAMLVEAPMRIACYCRHQGEKVGFRVIFTIKDYEGRTIAQQWTESILITDDHKTQNSTSAMNGACISYADPSQFGPGYFSTPQGHVQPALHRPYHSTNDLQSLGHSFGPRYLTHGLPLHNPDGFIPNMTDPYAMKARSRQASPSAHSGPNKKRKSSTSPHLRLPSTLTMTPRVDPSAVASHGLASVVPAGTSMAPSTPIQSAGTHPPLYPGVPVPASVTMPPRISSGPPTPSSHLPTPSYNHQIQQSRFPFATPDERLHIHPQAGIFAQFNTGPPTPNSPSAPTHSHQWSDGAVHLSYHISAPSSTYPSRPQSPMATVQPPPPNQEPNGHKAPAAFLLPSSSGSDSGSQDANMDSDSNPDVEMSSAPAPAGAHQGASNSQSTTSALQSPGHAPQPTVQTSQPTLHAAQRIVHAPQPTLHASQPTTHAPRLSTTNTNAPSQPPKIYEVLPPEGPLTGGIKVNCLGTGFRPGMEVVFGDAVSITTTLWGDHCLVCLLPPSSQAGQVLVTIRNQPPPMHQVFFTYQDDRDRQMLEAAMKVLSKKHFGTSAAYKDYARAIVASYNTTLGPLIPSSRPGENVEADAEGSILPNTEADLLKCLDLIDLVDTVFPSHLDLPSENGLSLLSLAASKGYERLVAGLLARGADPDVRDRNGFTPLMMASLHGHSQIVRRLILKGADPALYSLQGYTASHLASSLEVTNSLQGMHYHTRSRSACQLGMQSRPGSMMSLASLWEPPSPAEDVSSDSDDADVEFTEEDNQEDQQPLQHPPWISSRRNSGTLPDVSGLTQPVVANGPVFLGPMAAVNAWRDHLAAQIAYFHRQFPNFQLPTLPPIPTLPDYQAYPVVRHISSLVPHRAPPSERLASPEVPPSDAGYGWRDMFSASSLPPSYEEAVAESSTPREEVDHDLSLKKSSALRAATEAVLDHQCTEAYDGASSSTTQSLGALDVVKIGRDIITPQQQEQMRNARLQKLKRVQSDRKLFFIWLPLLVFMLCAMLKNCMPQVFDDYSLDVPYLYGRAMELLGRA